MQALIANPDMENGIRWAIFNTKDSIEPLPMPSKRVSYCCGTESFEQLSSGDSRSNSRQVIGGVSILGGNPGRVKRRIVRVALLAALGQHCRRAPNLVHTLGKYQTLAD